VFAYVALTIVLVIWAARTPNLNPTTLTLVLVPKVPLVMAATGMAIVLISKGIDLSVGSTVSLAYVIVARWTPAVGSPWLAALLALLVTATIGLTNGLMVGVWKLPALVVTLATGSIAAGIALYVCPLPVYGTIPAAFTNVIITMVGPVPLALVLAFALPALIWYPVRHSKAGTALLAVGGDEAAAFVSGLTPWRSRALAYTLSGLFAGLAGVLLSMTTGAGATGAATTYTLNAIAAAVLGGVALTGGRGSIAGAIGGAFVLTFITSFLTSWHINPSWSNVVSGGILVLVVGVPYLVNQARARRAPA
jgi:ribose/xylose/arabinose/galactoside ABC-type transport system permease subunit